ncbi:MAG: HPr family phosphocarrier protein [Desulfobacterales bacterium]|nr:HPr family phosphocarrier protein [Desulfobacterales bacterium]
MSLKKLSKKLTIKNPLGIHLVPATKIATIAKNAENKVWLIKNNVQVDASKVLDILALICEQHTEISIKIEHYSDSKILYKLIELIENGFGELDVPSKGDTKRN